MPPFQDPEIQQTSHSYFCNPVPDTDNHDDERPSKRARLANKNDDQSVDDMQSKIVSKMYGFLGIQDKTALTGLYQNAV